MALLVLAGCAHDPKVAATVDGQAVSTGDVAIFANFLCANTQVGSTQVVPMATVNQVAVTYLAGTKAVESFARAKNLTLGPVTTPPSAALQKLPQAEQVRAQELINEVSAAVQALPLLPGVKSSAVSTDQVPALFALALEQAQSKGQVVSNPAYPVLSRSGETSGSLSAPVSDAATALTEATTASDYLAALPVGQKCSQ